MDMSRTRGAGPVRRMAFIAWLVSPILVLALAIGLSDWRMAFITWLFFPILVLALAIVSDERRHAKRVWRFWCRSAGRDVEVTFVRNKVYACSAFEPPGAITCRRACRDGDNRKPREPALPLRVTPAMEAGVSDHVWALDEIAKPAG